MTDRPPCQTESIETSARRAATPRDREREQARGIVDAWTYLNEAKRALAEKGGNGDIFAEILRADEDLIRCFVILLGINPENEGTINSDDDRVAWWDSLTRDEHLDMPDGGAWFYMDRVLDFVAAATSTALSKKRAQGAVHHLHNAQSALMSLDRGLWRDDVVDLPTIGRPGIGHGSVNMLCKRQYQSTVYDRRWFLGTAEHRHRVPPWLPTYRKRVTQELRDQLAQYIVVQNVKARAIGLFCGIYDDPPDPQCRVHEAFRLIWVEAAKAYQRIFDDPLSDGWLTGVDLGGWAGFYLPKCGGRP